MGKNSAPTICFKCTSWSPTTNVSPCPTFRFNLEIFGDQKLSLKLIDLQLFQVLVFVSWLSRTVKPEPTKWHWRQSNLMQCSVDFSKFLFEFDSWSYTELNNQTRKKWKKTSVSDSRQCHEGHLWRSRLKPQTEGPTSNHSRIMHSNHLMLEEGHLFSFQIPVSFLEFLLCRG